MGKGVKSHKDNNNNSNNNNTNNAIGDDVKELKGVFGSVVSKVEERIKVLEEKEAHWEKLNKQMDEHAETASQKIVLDIGMCLLRSLLVRYMPCVSGLCAAVIALLSFCFRWPEICHFQNYLACC